MYLGKALMVTSVVCGVIYTVFKGIRKCNKSKESLHRDDGSDLFLECFDEMISDIRQMHKQQNEQGERLTRLESIINRAECK